MKKICCFIGSLSSGGAEHQMCLLTSFLAEKGYDVTIITIDDVEDHYPLDIRVKRVRLAQGKSYIVKLLSFMSAALCVKADVVLTWGLSQNVFLLPPLLLRPDVSVICGERNFTAGRNSKWERILYAGLYIKSKYIVANSYSQTEYEKDKHPFFASRMKTITNYTEIDKYVYKQVKHSDEIRVGVVARCEEQKNVHRFLRALGNVKRLSNQPFHVDWYGNRHFNTQHQQKYYEDCLQIIKDNSLEGDVEFKDATTKVHEVISQYDVMCLPSLFEGFSNSLSEYICCGRPVLCSDVSDNHVMVHNGENGFLFDPLSEESIVESFLSFFKLSGEERDRMCNKSREIAELLFNKEKFVAEYIRCIEGR